MADATTTAAFQCGQCPARYVRLDHLHRHELKHQGRKSCICKFCDAQFYRRDILRRHYKTCRERGDRPIPSAQPRGRRKQACDRCAINKLACDLERPCQSCADRDLVCLYTRVQSKDRAPAPVAVNDPELANIRHDVSCAALYSASGRSPSPSASPSPPPPPSLSPEPLGVVIGATGSAQLLTPRSNSLFPLKNVPVSFLCNLASLETNTLTDSFGYCSAAPEPLPRPSLPAASSQPPWEFPIEQGAIDRMHGFMRSSSGTRNAANSSFLDDLNSNRLNLNGQGMLMDSTSAEVFRDSPESNNSSSVPNPTRRRLNELVMQLTDVYINLPKAHSARAPTVRMRDADKYFTVSNFHVFTQTYFHHFYPHCPIIHRATFGSSTATHGLILVVCLAGALYSSLQDSIMIARSLLDLAEEYIFQNPCFGQKSEPKSSGEALHDSVEVLEALQAALTITVLQNWEGSEAARRRVRTERFRAIVSTMRRLNSTTTQRPFFNMTAEPQNFEWIEDILPSENIAEWMRFRVMNQTFILDTLFCILYNYPPRTYLAGIAADLPCPEEIYGALTSTACFQKANAQDILRNTKLLPILKLLMGNNLDEESKTILAKLTTFDYFITINALTVMIWTAQANVLDQVATINFDRALSRWKTFWEMHKKQSNSRNFKRQGFMKSATDYWWLARLKLFLADPLSGNQVGDGEDVVSFAPLEDDQMNHLRILLRRFCPLEFSDQID